MTVLVLLWVGVALLVPLLGGRFIAPSELLDSGAVATIFWSLRLPRTLLALLAGGALAMAGLALQTLFRNPLAEPYTLGIASGAAVGAVLVLQLESLGRVIGFPVVALADFAGAILVAGAILGFAVSA